MNVKIYVEGGSQGSAKSACRMAFRLFLEKVVPAGSFAVVALGDRAAAFRGFCLALQENRRDFLILLVDSEESVSTGAWEHLAAREEDQWQRPHTATNDQAHLMVQVMESWFLADREALTAYYGHGFLSDSLPGQRNVELVAKRDLFRALDRASRHTKKGTYHKTRHGFDLLERLDPQRVRAASAHADRLFLVLQRETTD